MNALQGQWNVLCERITCKFTKASMWEKRRPWPQAGVGLNNAKEEEEKKQTNKVQTLNLQALTPMDICLACSVHGSGSINVSALKRFSTFEQMLSKG